MRRKKIVEIIFYMSFLFLENKGVLWEIKVYLFEGVNGILEKGVFF